MAGFEDFVEVGPVLNTPEGFAAGAQAARFKGIMDAAAKDAAGAQHGAGTHVHEAGMGRETEKAEEGHVDDQEHAFPYEGKEQYAGDAQHDHPANFPPDYGALGAVHVESG